MRVIKFRVWEPEMKRMVYDLQVGKENAYQNRTLMQFTGLKDKNGKEIYEGDLLKQSDGVVKEVGFKSGMFGKGVDFNFYQISQDDEIIGNSYENPDLLK